MRRQPVLSKACRGSLRSVGAFSLVEISIALMILTFGVVALLGLMPVGLGSFSDARDRTVRAEILKSVSSDLSSMRYQELDSWIARGGETGFLFDDEGTRLASTDTGRAIYAARVRGPVQNSRLPGVDGSLIALPGCRTLLVEIRRIHEGSAFLYPFVMADRGL